MDPRRLRDAEDSMTVFMHSVEMPIDDEKGQIFLTLTHQESCWVHFATVLAIDSINDAVEKTGKAEPLLLAALKVNHEMWDKILGSVRVQIFGEDPETNDKEEES